MKVLSALILTLGLTQASIAATLDPSIPASKATAYSVDVKGLSKIKYRLKFSEGFDGCNHFNFIVSGTEVLSAPRASHALIQVETTKISTAMACSKPSKPRITEVYTDWSEIQISNASKITILINQGEVQFSR